MSKKSSRYRAQLKEIAQQVSVTSSLRVQFDIIVTKLRTVMAVDACCVYVVTSDNELTLAAADGLPQEAIGKAKVKLQDGLTGNIAAHQTLINSSNAAKHPSYIRVDATYQDNLSSYLGVPFIKMGATIGVLSIMSSKRRRFSKIDEAFLSTAATQLSALLNTAAECNFGTANCDLYKGVPGAPGAGVGLAYILMTSDLLSVADRNSDDIDYELTIWKDAIRRTIEELEDEGICLDDSDNSELAEIVEAYVMIVNSSEFQRKVEANIAKGMWAQGALKQVIYEIANKFLSLDDPYMRSRGEDFVNIGNKLYSHLLQQEQPQMENFTEPVVLVAPLISVLQLAKFDRKWVRGIVCIGGSALSHTAIMAKSLGIPAVMGVSEAVDIAPSDRLVVDGARGEVHVNPKDDVVQHFTQAINDQEQLNEQLMFYKDSSATTKGGTKVPILANIGFDGDIEVSQQMGAEGVGLFRSEFPFMARNDFPSELQQTEIYSNALENFPHTPVVIRTLDIGGDKGLSYMPIEEENPFLGWRGVRFTLDNSAVFLTQLRALLRASIGRDNLYILVPMVSDVSEIIRFKELLAIATQQLLQEDIVVTQPQVGIMVEVPSIVEMMNSYHHLIDFISIGSNDLTQYLMAVDRGNPRVAHLYDSLNPAVLKVMKRVIDSAKHYKIKVGVCGEMAADPVAIPLLVAMKVDGLSVSPRNIPFNKWLVNQLDDNQLESLLEKALDLPSAAAVRACVKEYLVTIDTQGFMEKNNYSF